MTTRTIKLTLVGALLLALGAAQALAQGIPIIYCAEQDPETPRCDGTDATESLVGLDSRDVIRAFAGDDIINAERGADDAFGGTGVDNVNGGRGDDDLSGGGGLDTVSDGVMENGKLSTGDTDGLRGNGGDDFLDTRDDDFLDTVECGRGDEDVAFVDGNPRSARSDGEGARARWKRIDRAFRRGEELPPVSLFKIGDSYFVDDGNHRVSVARYHGVSSGSTPR